MKKTVFGLLMFGVVATASATTTQWIPPTAPGSFTGWVSSDAKQNFTDVDESSCNGNTDYVSATTAGSRDSYVVSLASVPDGAKITGVYISPCLSQNISTTTPSYVSLFYKINGTLSGNGTLYSLKGTSPITYSYSYFSVPSITKTSSTKLEAGVVLTQGVGGARLSRIATVVAYSIPPTPPTAPSNLSITQSQDSGGYLVSLTWKDNSSNESYFVLEKSTDGVNYFVLSYPSANITNYSEYMSTQGTYYYRIRAYNTSGGYSGYSNVSSVSLVLPVGLPIAPSNLVSYIYSASSSAGVGSTTLILYWTDNAMNEDGFEVERSSDGATFMLYATTTANYPFYVEPITVFPIQSYYYRVRAFNSYGYSAYTGTNLVTFP